MSTSILDKNNTIFQGHEADLAKDLIVAEYNSLTTELNNRQNIRYQMVQLAIAALGALLTVSWASFQLHMDMVLIWAYPLLVLILSVIYTTNTFEMRRIRFYIKNQLEQHMLLVSGWQNSKDVTSSLGTISMSVSVGAIGNLGGKLALSSGGSVGDLGGKIALVAAAIASVGLGWYILYPTWLNSTSAYTSLALSCISPLCACLLLFFGDKLLSVLSPKCAIQFTAKQGVPDNNSQQALNVNL